jgi:signal transduction histidine kinase
MICISAPYHDQRILEAERYWIHEDGYVLLSAVQGSSTISDRQGVLVLSFSTRDSLPEQREQDWQCHPDLPVCILLVGAFLDDKQINLAASVQHKQSAIETFSLAGNIPVGASDFKIIVDQERRRIARDIHDDIAQRMVHALYKLELVQRLLEQQQFAMAYTEVQHAYTHITKSLQHLRQYILSLRPAELEGYSLAAELPLLLDEYRVNYPEVTLLCTCSQFDQVPSHLEATVFRFFQETLSNAYKHARATYITLSMSSDDNALSLEVRDNGCGFQPALLPHRISTHIGLQALQERASEVGGYIDIQSEPGLGTHIKAVFPISASPVIRAQEQGPGAMRK